MSAGDVHVRFFAAAAEAAGREQMTVAAASLSGLRALLSGEFGAGFERVWHRCSFLVDGVTATDPHAPLAPGVTVDVLPPFAGG